MIFFTFLYKNLQLLCSLALVSFCTANIISPMHEDLVSISMYAVELMLLFIVLGFMALKFQKPYVMLICFVGSISLCNHLQKKDNIEITAQNQDNLITSNINESKILFNTIKNIKSNNSNNKAVHNFSLQPNKSLKD